MREKFDITFGIVAYIITNILIFFGIVVSCILIGVTGKTNDQLSVLRTDTQQQLSVLTQKLDEKEKERPIYYVIKEEGKEDENVHNKVECAIPF